ncbi:Uncharacterized protein, MJ0678-like [hydrothermal vent metagenome]|uniref:Uncharacterized protein, MJ0678-like n=1 Tax=hydrothermal vent metagenome TaxID=652676 RepID=A0A3B1AW88_9ZZZZ
MDTLHGLAEHHELLDFWATPCEHDGRCSIRLLLRSENQQQIVDAIQSIIGSSENSRVVIMPVEATIPRPEIEEDTDKSKGSTTRTREELYQTIVRGIQLDSTFIWMVVLSTIVASIGLLADNVAVVIAPLLGPNLALAFASSLGDSALIWQSLKTNIVGLSIALVISILLGYLWPYELTSQEIILRTDIGYDGVVLALVAGAAAVLSLASGLSNTLVGVMVAVTLLPPAATLGLMLGSQQFDLAIGASLLLAINIVSVNLSAKLAFITKGVKPRTWIEKNKATQSRWVSIVFWLVSLGLLLIFMQLWHNVL